MTEPNLPLHCCSCSKIMLALPCMVLITFDILQSQDETQIISFQRKAEVNHEIQQLKTKMRDSQVSILLFDFTYCAKIKDSWVGLIW